MNSSISNISPYTIWSVDGDVGNIDALNFDVSGPLGVSEHLATTSLGPDVPLIPHPDLLKFANEAYAASDTAAKNSLSVGSLAQFSIEVPSVHAAIYQEGCTLAAASKDVAAALGATDFQAPLDETLSVEWVVEGVASERVDVQTAQSANLIRLTNMRADPRFAGIDGSGYSVVVIDTGADLDHSAFGPDNNANGIADRIVFQYDFSGANDNNANDTSGHGTHVAGIVGSQNSSYLGMAPGVNLIILKVFPDGPNTSASWADIEEASQWVVNNAAAYNIVSVNYSLSGSNFNSAQVTDLTNEFSNFKALGIAPVVATGNNFYSVGSTPGVGAPASDLFAWGVGAVYDANIGPASGNGAIDFTTAPDRITAFTQRTTVPGLVEIFAPGAAITNAYLNNASATLSGTSMAAPHIAGIVALAQEYAVQLSGSRLPIDTLLNLMQASAVTVVDGDDENDNVINTGGSFKRVDVYALMEAIEDQLATDFASPTFELASFGPGAGGWSSDNLYKRELADVNGDGRADIVGFGSSGVFVSLATNNGHFASPTFELASFGPGSGGWSSDDLYKRELADVNGDGRADIVGFGSSGVYVSLATNNGHFASPTFELASFGPGAGGWSSDNLYKRELADVNGDGRADIVGFGSSGVYVSLATNDGHFASPTFELASFGPGSGGWSSDNLYKRELADVNGDGRADIVGFGSSGVYVSLATNNGHFASPTFELASFGPGAGGWSSDDLYKRELADVNGDGRADIVGFGNSGVYVSLATNNGHFASPTFELAGFGPGSGGWSSDNLYKRELADVDGDMKADIVGFAYLGVYVSHSEFLL